MLPHRMPDRILIIGCGCAAGLPFFEYRPFFSPPAHIIISIMLIIADRPNYKYNFANIWYKQLICSIIVANNYERVAVTIWCKHL